MVVEDSLPYPDVKHMDNLETQPMVFQLGRGQTHSELIDDDLSAQPLENDPSHGVIGPSQDPHSVCPSQVPGSDPALEELCPSQDRGNAELSTTSGNHSTGVGDDQMGSSSDMKDAPRKPSKSKKVLPPVPVMTPSDDTSKIPVPRTHSQESLA